MTEYNTKVLTLLEENKLIITAKDDFIINSTFMAFFDSMIKTYSPAKALFKSITMYCPDASENELITLLHGFHKILTEINEYKYLSFLISKEINK